MSTIPPVSPPASPRASLFVSPASPASPEQSQINTMQAVMPPTPCKQPNSRRLTGREICKNLASSFEECLETPPSSDNEDEFEGDNYVSDSE
jgi:hypothetical protein